jgi:endonuclease/exonuclease/phosphatase family metal-dependent hydrolase
VNGPKAVRRVFAEDEWDVFVSGRYFEDARTGAETDQIYTAFAVRRGAFDAVASSDVDALGVRDDADRSTRWGLELLVERDGARLLLLNVHLKSGCHDGALRSPRGENCRVLAAQRRPLDEWFDASAAGPTPFVIPGDFNRRFRVHGDRDHLWEAMDDGEPRGLRLFRLPDRPSDCNSCFEEPIDFFVFDGRAARTVVEDSFEETRFDAGDYDDARWTPSDHCPISVEVDFSGLD